MSRSDVRDGVGHRAYRRQQAALKRRTAREELPCGYGSPDGWGCGERIDTNLDFRHPMAFTADHPEAIDNGGRLVGQTLVPMHNRCNARKSNNATTEVWSAT